MKPISDARTCKDGCTYLRRRLHVLAGTVARTCGNGSNALRLRGAKLELKSSVLFWMREKAAP